MRAHRTLLCAALVVFVVAACADQPTQLQPEQPVAEAPLMTVQAGKKIEGSYIVVLKEGVNPRSVLAVAGIHPRYEYTAETLNGFSATLNQGQLRALQVNPAVAYIEEDQEMQLIATQTNAPWGLDRTDQRDRPLDGRYTYERTGRDVYVYVIDSGIRTSHSEFTKSNGTSRARNVWDGTGGNGQDCNGHGTHVAGTIGGRTYGMAKEAELRGVRVFGCSGNTPNSMIIAAVDWVRQNRVNPAVVNMSLGGGYSSALNTAVNNLSNSGVFVAVAAGNSSTNACNTSPASASGAYTVAASTSSDARASYSNYGSCVDIYAPGSSIRSAWHKSNTATNTISGTSMASPHVAGLAAMIKQTNPTASHSAIANWMTTNATTNRISGNPSGTPNRLLYKATW